MCSRYSQTLPADAMRSLFDYRNQVELQPREAIAPSEPVPVVRQTGGQARELVLMRWGLVPSWVKDPNDFSMLINARSETALEKPSFRAAMRHRRCLIPADGFYEWTGPKGERRPFHVARADGGPIAFAGLWEHWQGAGGEEMESVTILTTNANADLTALHHRMPVLLDPDDFDAWVDCERIPAEEVMELLCAAPDGLLEPAAVERQAANPRRTDRGAPEPFQGSLF